MARLVFASRTDTGKVRSANQDATFNDPARGLFVLADGMGGRPGGALAADIVVKTLPVILARMIDDPRRLGGKELADTIRRALGVLSDTVRESGARTPGYNGMGATVVIFAMAADGTAAVGNLGDARIYLAREGKVSLLTRDHSVTQILVESGELSEEAARTHPSRSQLTRYVGMLEDPLPDVAIVPLAPGDRFLLCSDGLSGEIEEKNLSALLTRFVDPDVAARELIAAALEAGGKDNVTVTVIDWRSEETPSPGVGLETVILERQ